MTTSYKATVQCSACGKKSDVTLLSSTSYFGSADLDTRPPPVARYSIDNWVQRCPSCGYCSGDLQQGGAAAAEIVNTQHYQDQLQDETYPDLANSFLCEAMIAERQGAFSTATWALTWAAWACDDAKLGDQAIHCRRRAAIMLVKAEEQGQAIHSQPGASTLILIDLLRRGQRPEKALVLANDYADYLGNDVIRRAIAYEVELIESGDLGCRTIADACKAVPAKELAPEDITECRNDQYQSSKRWWQFWK